MFNYTTKILLLIIALLSLGFALPAASPESAALDLDLDGEFNATALHSRDGGHFTLWGPVAVSPSFPNRPYCHWQKGQNVPGNLCMITGVRPDQQNGLDVAWQELYMYDHNCVQIGINTHVGYTTHGFNFDSQLPHVAIFNKIMGGNPTFGYAGKSYPRGDLTNACYNRAGSFVRQVCQTQFWC